MQHHSLFSFPYFSPQLLTAKRQQGQHNKAHWGWSLGSNDSADQCECTLLPLSSTIPGCSRHSKWALSHCTSWLQLFLLGINRPLPLCFIPGTASTPASCCTVCLCGLQRQQTLIFFLQEMTGVCFLARKVCLAQQTYWEENNPHLDCPSSIKGSLTW